jgi:hypothetical protein
MPRWSWGGSGAGILPLIVEWNDSLWRESVSFQNEVLVLAHEWRRTAARHEAFGLGFWAGAKRAEPAQVAIAAGFDEDTSSW